YPQPQAFASNDPRFPFPTGLEEGGEPPHQPKRALLMAGVGGFAGLVVIVSLLAVRARMNAGSDTNPSGTTSAS
ncbi:hypothetical protein ABXW85_22650, partial [Streptococcus suis]